MNRTQTSHQVLLEENSTIAVIGGGPAGAFFAIHFLKRARAMNRNVRVVLFERRWQRNAAEPTEGCHRWKGCNYCAGGISPRMNDVLERLELKLPAEVVQSRIQTITIHGYWKNIELEVPEGREMLSVYRGSRPGRRGDRDRNFDSFLLSQAVKSGAELISGEVESVRYSEGRKPLITYRTSETTATLEADFAVFAAGVNEWIGSPLGAGAISRSMKQLVPGFVAPRIRRALVFELESRGELPLYLANALQFVEYGSKTLPLEMCSMVPKRGFITAVVMGASVDAASNHPEHARIMKQFMQLPHVRKLLSPHVRLHPVCICAPNMVVRTARQPFGDRVAMIGDMATTRLYKDGILSAHRTARALADTILNHGVDRASLSKGYGPTLRHFTWDNRYASLVFLIHRIFFGSSTLSRILYQAVISERKNTPAAKRRLENLLWRIASGDDDYRSVFGSMIHPATIGLILADGLLITLRNYLTELAFGLRWEGFGRFTTGVAWERLEAKRAEFARLITESHTAIAEKLEFERMYTIRIRTSQPQILEQLGRFGEGDRGYFRPSWVRIHRVAGEPNTAGCIIQYDILCRRIYFRLMLEQILGGHLAVYRVMDGFAKGGVLIFEIEKLGEDLCNLSIYVAFNFTRGRNWVTRPFWWLLRVLFPAFMHDVLWNHSLCQFKDIVETQADEVPVPESDSACSCQTHPCAAAQ